ncbi:MDR family MFS transporter [Microbacterium sp. ZW T5_45]|uniref:MDR family MFS transporter n=1 Tax=Microbacterium sp. ZW T5_45 TaxID=3378080 RepID=UPI003854F9BD
MTTAPATRPTVREPLPPGGAALIGVLVASAFVVFLTETVMGVALPRLMDALSISAVTGQWLTTGYMLTMAILIPMTGFLLQRFGTRRVFLVAIALFSVGTLIAATAPGFEMLLLGRVVQAAGTSMVMPLLMTTTLAIVPTSRRGAMMGLVAVVVSSAPALGPTAAGAVLDTLGWRGLFWLILPFALGALVAGVFAVRDVGERTEGSIDLTSVVLSTIGFGGVVYGLANMGEAGSAGVHPAVPIVIGLVALAAFVARQLRLQKRDAALLDLRVFRDGLFTRSFVLLTMVVITQFGVVILLPIYLQNVLAHSALQTGVALLPGGLVSAILALAVGAAYDRIGPRPLLIGGGLVFSASLWGMTTLDTQTPLWIVIALHMTMSAGVGGLFTPLFSASLGSLTPQLHAHGSAAINTINQVGGALGTATYVTVMTLGSAEAAAAGATAAAAAAAGIHNALVAGAFMSLLVAAGAFLVVRRRRRTTGTETPVEE